MSTTTSPILCACRFVVVVAGLVAFWIGLMAATLFVTGRADAVIAVFPAAPPRIIRPGSAAMLGWSGLVGRFVGAEPGYVRDLYRAGALIVLPANAGGCLGLDPPRGIAAPRGGGFADGA